MPLCIQQCIFRYFFLLAFLSVQHKPISNSNLGFRQIHLLLHTSHSVAEALSHNMGFILGEFVTMGQYLSLGNSRLLVPASNFKLLNPESLFQNLCDPVGDCSVRDD